MTLSHDSRRRYTAGLPRWSGGLPTAAFAAGWGVEKAPALLLWPGDAAAPQLLAARLTGASLAYRLEKHSP